MFLIWNIALVLASKLEKTLFDELNIEEAIKMPIIEPIDFSIKYFITKTLLDDEINANNMILSTSIDNKFSKLLVARGIAADDKYIFDTKVRNRLLREVSKEISEEFYKNKYKFKNPILLSTLHSKSEIRDILINVGSMDKLLLMKFYYYIESRLIDPKEALDKLKYLAKKKETYANFLLGNFYLYGMGVEQDLDLALEYFYAAKSDKSTSALTGIGKVMMLKNAPLNEVLETFKSSVEATNDAEADYSIFLVSKSQNKSETYENNTNLKNAAFNGYLPAVYEYSLVYADNNYFDLSNSALMSVTQFFLKFQEFESRAIQAYLDRKYKKAALIFLYLSEFNLPVATQNAIFILEKHPCLANTNNILFKTYQKLSKTNPEYYKNIGDFYFYGKGVEKSYTESFSAYLLSAKSSVQGAYNLAYMYENGLGVPVNYKRAKRTLSKYMKHGNSYLVYYYALIRINFKMLVFNYYFASIFAAALLIASSSFILLNKS